MIVFPNCKINLGLNIIRKRNDGYHDLETVFYPVAIKDALEIIPGQKMGFQVSGFEVKGSVDDNLCVKAYELLKKDFPELPLLNIYLHKAIPMGAGLGGGSSDCAFMLPLINKKFHLNISNATLLEYSLQLGSDCPFFIVNQPRFATGRGENLLTVDVDFSKYKMVLINPGIHVSTREAFSRLVPAPPQKSIKEIIAQPVTTWKDELVNDFEKSVFELFPEIKKIKKDLYEAGAIYASMTGSGSTIFGIFEMKATLNLKVPEKYYCRLVQ